VSDRTYKIEPQQHNDENCACLIVREAGETIAHYSMTFTELEPLIESGRMVAARVLSHRRQMTGGEQAGGEAVQIAHARESLQTALEWLAQGGGVEARLVIEKALWNVSVLEYLQSRRVRVGR
jgi:hypothetical protein